MWGRTWRTKPGARGGDGCGWLLFTMLLQHHNKPHHPRSQRKFLDQAQLLIKEASVSFLVDTCRFIAERFRCLFFDLFDCYVQVSSCVNQLC
jgi:hypothetical protein